MNTTENKRTQFAGHILGGPCKGMIFSLDAGISFTILLISILVFVLMLNNYAQKAVQNTENFELEEKALMIADSFVKNFDENNPIRGAGIYDSEKKRVKTNELTLENIKKAKTISFSKIFVQKISYLTKTREEIFTIDTDKNQTKECITAKRFALIDGEKGIIQIQTCREG